MFTGKVCLVKATVHSGGVALDVSATNRAFQSSL